MSLAVNKAEKSAMFAELKTDFLYIAIPFLVLIVFKLCLGDWKDVILSSDWSLASCLIFGQSASKVSRAVAATERSIVAQQFGWYTAKRFLLIIISLLFYFGMATKPSITLGVFQIFLFILASYFHFKDGFASLLIIRKRTAAS